MNKDADIQLADLLEYYPPIETEHFQTLVSQKYELSEFASDPHEKLSSGRGTFFKHQKLTHRYLRAFGNIIILDEPGTGKTCSVAGYLEWINDERIKYRNDPITADLKLAHYKQQIIIAPKILIEEIKQQIVCTCSSGHYETEKVLSAVEVNAQRAEINRLLLRAGYHFYTPNKFVSHVLKAYTINNEIQWDNIARDYSDTVFWLDEAHKLNEQPSTKETDARENLTKETIYNILHNIFHVVERAQVILTTATPMVNSPSELRSLINLILPSNKQIPANFNFDSATLEDLNYYLQGYVTYARAIDTGINIQYMGTEKSFEVEIDDQKIQTSMITYDSEMAPFQEEGYQNALRKDENQKSSGLYSNAIKASDFVFPDGTWGEGQSTSKDLIKEKIKIMERISTVGKTLNTARSGTTGSTKNAKKITKLEEQLQELNNEKARLKISDIITIADLKQQLTQVTKSGAKAYVIEKGEQFSQAPELAKALQGKTIKETIENVSIYSAKYASILRELQTLQYGNAFIYGDAKKGSGAWMIALCLEFIGYEHFTGKDSLLYNVLDTELTNQYCAQKSEEIETGKRVNIEKRKRYAYIHGDLSDVTKQNILNSFNSYYNRHGEYIQVLIATKVGREGINVNNVEQIYIFQPDWNPSNMDQAEHRALRATSHTDLVREFGNISVKIYLMVANPSSNVFNVDNHIYETVSTKKIRIQRIMKMLKQISYSCYINYNRNIHDADNVEDKYNCYDESPDNLSIDYINYDLLYFNEMLEKLITTITNIFKQISKITYAELNDLIPNNEKHIIMAMEHLISHHIPIINRYGYISYIMENEGVFYLENRYQNIIPSAQMDYYNNMIINKYQPQFIYIIDSVKVEKMLNSVRKAIAESASQSEVMVAKNILDAFSLSEQAYIIEHVIIQKVSDKSDDLTDIIINHYSKYIFNVRQPITELSAIYSRLEAPEVKRGRHRKTGAVRVIPRIDPASVTVENIDDLEPTSKAERIWFHTLKSFIISGHAVYGASSKETKPEYMRLLVPSKVDDGWRDLSEVERAVYGTYVQKIIIIRDRFYENLPLYGYYLITDNKFRVVDNTKEKGRRIQNSSGADCNSFKKSELINLMSKLGVTSQYVTELIERVGDLNIPPKNDIINYLIKNYKVFQNMRSEMNKWDNEKLILYYIFYNKLRHIKKEELCVVVESYMNENDLVKKSR